jgi:hypothetical protein
MFQFLDGSKTPLVWIINHFWWFEISTPCFCKFLSMCFASIMFGLRFLCIIGGHVFLVWRWCAIMVISMLFRTWIFFVQKRTFWSWIIFHYEPFLCGCWSIFNPSMWTTLIYWSNFNIFITICLRCWLLLVLQTTSHLPSTNALFNSKACQHCLFKM